MRIELPDELGELLRQRADSLGLPVNKLAEQMLADTADRLADDPDSSQPQYREILDYQPDLICRYKPDTTIVYVNDACCHFFGKTREELIGYSFLPYTLPANHDDIRQRIQNLKRNPLSPIVHEEINLNANGEQRAIQWLDTSLVDEHGNVALIQGVGRDITHLKQMEQQLAESETRFRLMVEAAYDGILLVDHTGQITLVNRRIESLFEYDREELVGQPLEVLLPEDLRGRHTNLRESYMHSPAVREMGKGLRLAACRKDGSHFYIDAALVPLELNGQVDIMCVVRDVTERIKYEEQRIYTRTLEFELETERELAELRGQFVSMMAHEFRTPLAIIQSAIDIVRNYHAQLSQEDVWRRLDSIGNQVSRLVDLLDSVLALMRGEVYRVEINPESVDLRAFCKTVIEEAASAGAGRPRQELVLELADDLPKTILIDPEILRHVLDNLLGNALKYSHKDTPVRLQVLHKTDQIEFRVKDHGIGIPPEDHHTIFAPFMRARNSRKTTGSGLGLAIVKQNIEALGGSISFESTPGEGSIFYARIPVQVLA